jgi:hypothetical protein
MRRPRRWLATFGLFLGLAGGGCVLLEQLGLVDPDPVFSHSNHSDKEDLECRNCHLTFASADAAGMPKRKVCILCHEGVDEEKPKDRRIAALFKEDVKWRSLTALDDEVIFSHKVHHDAKVACAECHRGIEENTHVTESLRIDMKGCVDCHARLPMGPDKASVPISVQAVPPAPPKGPPFTPKRAPRAGVVANDCVVCHREIRRGEPPPTHKLGWKRHHGQGVRNGGTKTADRCALCHTEASCSACHREEAPASHTSFWKDRGHGLAAGLDRSSCAVCHQSDACDRCHRETAPRSHVGSWGPPRSRHCLYCHEGANRDQQSCNLCHARIRHAAPPRPADPQHLGVPESQCRNCHSIIEMQHVDNGDACVRCH